MERAKRFSNALRKYWKRLLIGALTGWLVINALLIAAIILTEWQHYRYDDYTAARIAQTLLMFSFPAGALVAYSWRERKES